MNKYIKIKYFQMSYKTDLTETQEPRQEPPETGGYTLYMWSCSGYILSLISCILIRGS